MTDTCKRGHPFVGDNLYVDPTGYRRCRTCKRMCRQIREDPDAREPLRPLLRTYLPVEPLRRLAPKPIHDELGVERGGLAAALTVAQERKYHRAVSVGRVTLAAADELSVAFGYHPAEVWGDEYWDAV